MSSLNLTSTPGELPVGIMGLPLLVLALLSLLPNVLIVVTFGRMSSLAPNAWSSLPPTPVSLQLVVLAVVDVFCAAFTLFNYIQVLPYATEDDQIADLTLPLQKKDGIIFHRHFFVMLFRDLDFLLRTHVAVIPFIANRVFKALMCVVRCRCLSNAGVAAHRNRERRHHLIEAAGVGVAFPVVLVVVFLVAIPALAGPLRQRAWLWFYYIFFVVVTFGPLLVVFVCFIFILVKTRKIRRLHPLAQQVEGDAELVTSGATGVVDVNRTSATEAGVVNDSYGRSVSEDAGVEDTRDAEVRSADLSVTDPESVDGADASIAPLWTDLRGASRGDAFSHLVEVLAGILLFCNLSWVWFLLDPSAASWMLFTSFGMLNSFVNFFVCLLLSRNFRSAFSQLVRQIWAKIWRMK